MEYYLDPLTAFAIALGSFIEKVAFENVPDDVFTSFPEGWFYMAVIPSTDYIVVSINYPGFNIGWLPPIKEG